MWAFLKAIQKQALEKPADSDISDFVSYQDIPFAKGRRLPDPGEHYYTYAGEIPWCDTFPRTRYDEKISIPISKADTIEEKTVEFDVEIPVATITWESYHSVVNPGQSAAVPNKEICTKLNLHIAPQSFDMLGENGKKASITLRRGEWPNTHNLIFIRKDLLEFYLKSVGKELVWVVWGEREYSVDNNEGLFEFQAKNQSYKFFQEVVTYSQMAKRHKV